jgi:glucose-1-phosphate thymidylyltransferase
MKALILAAGKGTRLRPLTATTPKHLLPVANKPILYYVLEQLKEANLSDIGIVISPDSGPAIRAAVKDGSQWGVTVTYILQQPPLGLAHAVKAAAGYLGDSPFLLFLGDNLIKNGVKDILDSYRRHSPDALIVLKEVVDPRAFGVAEVDTQGKVQRVVEKPKEPKSNLALVGAYIFSPFVLRVIDELKPSWRGEYEITDAIQNLLEKGQNVISYVLDGWWLDTGKKEDLLEANRTILQEYLPDHRDGRIDSQSRCSGSIGLGTGSQIENSEIRGPVVIGAHCRIVNSCLGPFTSVGDETLIQNSAVENSIILDHASIQGIGRIENSLIGRHAEIKIRTTGSAAATFCISDDSKIEL